MDIVILQKSNKTHIEYTHCNLWWFSPTKVGNASIWIKDRESQVTKLSNDILPSYGFLLIRKPSL